MLLAKGFNSTRTSENGLPRAFKQDSVPSFMFFLRVLILSYRIFPLWIIVPYMIFSALLRYN